MYKRIYDKLNKLILYISFCYGVWQMNLRYYRIFVEVYEQMNMSFVAEQMFLSQPAVSRIIRELEDYYGIRFFLRQSGRLIRTEGGTRFYQYAKELLMCEEQLTQAMADQRRSRKITLGAAPTVATNYLPPIIQAYRSRCGDLDVRLFSSRLEALEQMLLDSRMEIAVVEGRLSSWELVSLRLFEDDLVLVATAGLPAPDLSKPLPLLVRDAGEMERHRFEQVFRDAQVEYAIQGELVDVEAIKRCAQCGLGVGLVPRGCIRPEDGLQEVSIPGISLSAQYSVVFHRKRFLFRELIDLIDFLFVQWNGQPATKLYPDQLNR